MNSFISLAVSKQVRTRAFKVALLVGSILALINHGESVLTTTLTSQVFLKIALSYLVPYSVSTWSAVRAIQDS